MINEQQLKDNAERLAELELCANGNPYFLIVQIDEQNTSMRVTPNFEIDSLFEAIRKLIQAMPEYKDNFINEIITLSKTI